MKKSLFLILSATFATISFAQRVSNIRSEIKDDKVHVHYQLRSSRPVNIALEYSFDNGQTWLPCKTKSGSWQNQTSGDKTVVWHFLADHVLAGELLFRVSTMPVPPGVVGCNSNISGWGSSLGTVSFASDRTWRVGSRTWSDAVQASNCNKTTYSGGTRNSYNSDCRSNPDRKGDLFSCCAIVRFGSTLCPAPWRVPSTRDFANLERALGGSGRGYQSNTPLVSGGYLNTWGGAYGGGCNSEGPLNDQGSRAYYWTQSELSSERGHILLFDTRGHTVPQGWSDKGNGLALRCVR